jgi:hypothetical protein
LSLRVWLDVLFDDINAFDNQMIVKHGQYVATTALVAARDYNDFITFANLVHNYNLVYWLLAIGCWPEASCQWPVGLS